MSKRSIMLIGVISSVTMLANACSKTEIRKNHQVYNAEIFSTTPASSSQDKCLYQTTLESIPTSDRSAAPEPENTDNNSFCLTENNNDALPPDDNSQKSNTGAFIADELLRLEGKTGEQLDYEGHWCALVLWDIITDNGYDAPPAYDPCELAINLLDNDLANFYCLRAENKESLIEYGLKNQERVISVTYNDFLPKKGDMVCYLWD